MQFKKILAYALTVCLLLSLTVPAYAVDEVYTVFDDSSVLSAPIFYTPDYYPGAVAEMRSSGLFANPIAHGSYSELNYNPSWFYKSGSSTYPSGDFNALTPSVTADQTDVSGIYYIPNTTFLSGSLLAFRLPSTDDCYFDFQSSNFLFDQQSPQANTFYINGDLTFSLRNLWAFNGSNGDGVAVTDSWYLASDPLAVQLVIDGKAYGDIIDVTSYTSPFTALYNGGVPSNATVSFDNLKVYYQGDTPDMIGFRVYTGSAFTDGQYNYINGGQFVAVDVTNSVTFRCSEIPDITFVQEGGDGYAGDLSGITTILNQILSGISGLRSLMVDSSGRSYLNRIFSQLYNSVADTSWLNTIYGQLHIGAGQYFLNYNGDSSTVGSDQTMGLANLVGRGFVGLRSLMVNSSGKSFLSIISDNLTVPAGTEYLHPNGETITSAYPLSLSFVVSRTLVGLRAGQRKIQASVDALKSYESDTVFPWQSYNMETHELNAATNITGQNNLFFTAFQSIEDKLGRLAYVFGSDEDLALKDEADPGTDAFRENFGGGASLSDIKDSAELATSVPQLMDSGFDFADGIEEIGSNDGYLAWFSSETWSALDSTGAAVAADPDYLSDYYDNLRKVEEKRHWGD